MSFSWRIWAFYRHFQWRHVLKSECEVCWYFEFWLWVKVCLSTTDCGRLSRQTYVSWVRWISQFVVFSVWCNDADCAALCIWAAAEVRLTRCRRRLLVVTIHWSVVCNLRSLTKLVKLWPSSKCLHCLHSAILCWNIAVTALTHSNILFFFFRSLSCGSVRFDVANPKFIGRRSASTVLSQDCLGRPILRLQSSGGPIMQACRAR